MSPEMKKLFQKISNMKMRSEDKYLPLKPNRIYLGGTEMQIVKDEIAADFNVNYVDSENIGWMNMRVVEVNKTKHIGIGYEWEG